MKKKQLTETQKIEREFERILKNIDRDAFIEDAKTLNDRNCSWIRFGLALLISNQYSDLDEWRNTQEKLQAARWHPAAKKVRA